MNDQLHSVVVMGFSLLLVAVAGCSSTTEPPPVTQKTKGVISYPDGKPYAKGGAISFTHETKAGVTSNGAVMPDGSFTLHSITAQHKVLGAPEGTYSVMIAPESQEQIVQPIIIKKKYTIAPGENNLTIVIEP